MSKGSKFGTFGGVFTPSILTILGVIMFLRLPMIVGEAGLVASIGIIMVAHIISVITGLSVSSIATDKKVEAGGTYYMISRSLGLPIGGTLGLALFVGLSFSVSLYLIGFAESFLGFWGYETSINNIRIAGTVVLVTVTTITFISTSLAIKTQYFIMAAILVSLISIFAGSHELGPQIGASIESGSNAIPFMVLFGIFFPAVTGFEAGVSMSGDLKDPKTSIPKGSILAILIGLLIYLGLVFFFSFTVDRNLLSTDPQILLKISWIPELVVAGIWGATLSSALGSILGAPRILQATAVDKITPGFFGKGFGASNEPRNALLFTFLIAEAGILIGELDVIARIVSIFFITTYGFINLSCAFEGWTSADFRPSFKTPVWVSFLGAAACFLVMIQLDIVAAFGATLILGSLYLYLKRKELSLQTGDTWGGVWSSLAKASLHQLFTSTQHNRNWRANILMFNGADQSRPFMMGLGKAISGKLGILSSFELVASNEPILLKPQRSLENKSENGKVFHHTYSCTSPYIGIDEIARVYGFGGVEPNTVLMGWSKKPENKEKFIALLSNLQRYKLNTLLLHHNLAAKKLVSPTIDIWWNGWGRNLSFALNLVRNLTSADPWRRANVRLCIIINNEEDTDRINRYIKNIFQQYRVNATIKLLDNHIANQARQEIIVTESVNTDLALIGIPDNHYEDLEATYQYVTGICNHLGSALFINASEIFEEHVVINRQTDSSTLSKSEWILPDLAESIYPEISDDIRKIDAHGMKLIEALHKKVFAACLDTQSAIFKKVNSLAGTTSASLNKAMHQSETYQKRAAVLKSKKYFNTQIAQLIDLEFKNQVNEQDALIKEGVDWYLEQLETDANHFPKSKSIRYLRKAFMPQSSDVPSLRLYKLRKRVFHPFSRKSISIKVNYRRGAAYFFRDNRFVFLKILLNDLQNNAAISLDKFRQFITWTDDSFQTIINVQDPVKQDEILKEFASNIREKAEALSTLNKELISLYQGRLQVEYRKHVLFFMHQLERINFDTVIRKKARSRGSYLKLKEFLKSFPTHWSDREKLLLTTLRSNALLLDYFGTVETVMLSYSNRLRQFFVREQQQPIERLIDALTSVASTALQSKQQSLPEWEFDYDFTSSLLRESSEQLLAVANSLPEEVTIVVQLNSESEGLTIPLRAMVGHLTETIISGPINDKLEVVLEKVKRSKLVISDQASLAMFNMFNLKESDEDSLREEEVNRAVRVIKKELAAQELMMDSTLKEVERQVGELKGGLKLHHLTDLSGEFSSLVRSRKKRRLQTKLSSTINQIKDRFKQAFVSVLYSEAKGILLARQLSTSTQTLSVNERIMKVVASTTPNQQLLQELPHYYVSLFNGRSSIGDNFWVTRPVEEKQFQLAHNRYLTTRQGAILVLGERNAGKTALCKHFGEAQSDSYTIFHVFPPEDGSVRVEDFEASLQKATQFEGDSSQIISLLPHNSMVVIHDLELWWERSEDNGLTLIQHIKFLIEQYSQKCLFIINMNSFGFGVINAAEPIDTHCAGVVRCRPFDSLELKQLIMTRHKSSGLSLRFGAGDVDTFGEIKLARVFNKLFTYSKGNPGVAMNAWLTGIRSFKNKTVLWETPTIHGEDVFSDIHETWLHLCLQLLLHKRMSREKIIRSVALDKHQIIKILEVMRRLQLVDVRGGSIYYLNQNMAFLLRNHFREKEWI